MVGCLYLGSLSSFTTVAQLRAPAALRGRVVSVLMMLIGALYPIGSIVQGAIADEIGLRATTAGAAVLLGALLLAWRVLRPGAADAIGDTITTAALSDGPRRWSTHAESPAHAKLGRWLTRRLVARGGSRSS